MLPDEVSKLDEIILKLNRIEKALDIVADREDAIIDFDSSVNAYAKFAKDELNLEKTTIDNHRSSILAFLNHSKGIINKDTVREYLQSNESESWRTNKTKALRKYIRNFLRLGKWIEDFQLSKTSVKLKEIPSDEVLVNFIEALPYQMQLISLILHNSGLRIGEVLTLTVKDVNFEINMINASLIHKGSSKSSWISFVTNQTAGFLKEYIQNNGLDSDSNLFSISARSVQNSFKKVSIELGFTINPHLLRTVFAEKCTQANMSGKYIDAFCGRIPQSVLAKHYTDYSPTKLREQYKKVEPILTF